uniref:VWFA domain-containing protein n=1 Tax=Poecilia latipinna TaxID=48699 RepID=A0A3B3U593_9TELE
MVRMNAEFQSFILLKCQQSFQESEPGQIEKLIKCQNATLGDIVFLVDSSGSIGEENIRIIRTFLRNVIQNLDIGPDKVQVGLAVYGDRPKKEFLLKDHMDRTAVLDAVEQIAFLRGGTNTGKAMDFIREEYFTAEAGSRARQHVPQIAVLLTDGNSNDDVSKPAKRLRDLNVFVFVIGVSQSNYDQLKIIANHPPEDYILTTNNFQTLQSLRNTLLKTVCSSLSSTVSGCCCWRKAEGTLIFGQSRCQIPRGFCCRHESGCVSGKVNTADVVFIIDESGGIGNNNFQLIQSFVQSLIGSLNVNQTGVRVGIVTYNEAPKAHAYLDSFQDQTEAQQFIKLLPYRGGGSNTGAALRFTLESVFKGRGRREDVQKVAIVVTDSKSQDSVKEAVAELHWFPVRVFAIGVNEKTPDLYDMASYPTNRHKDEADIIFLIDDSDNIDSSDLSDTKKFINNFLGEFRDRLDHIRIGLVKYSNSARFEFDRMSLLDVSKALNYINHEGGRTNTGRALTFMERHFKTVPYSQGSTYLIVITAGESEDSIRGPAEKIRAQGVMVFAVGVKRSNKAQLQEISGDPDRTFKVRDYYFLKAYIFNLKAGLHVFLLKTCNACTQNVCSLSNILCAFSNLSPHAQNLSLLRSNLCLQTSLLACKTFSARAWNRNIQLPINLSAKAHDHR